VILLLVSWVITINAKSNTTIQVELMTEAAKLMQDGIYVYAVPLLEEAAALKAKYTWEAEAMLKKAYLALIDTHGYRRKYIGLLEQQLTRKDAAADIFIEAASYYLNAQRTGEAFEIFRTGINRTGCGELIELYESNRYIYEINRVSYDYAKTIHEGKSQVKKDGYWGMAAATGNLVIPCVYEQISTFNHDRAIVKKDGEIFAVDKNNNRLALLRVAASDFGQGFADDRFPLLIEGAWRRVTGEFVIGTSSFEEIGMYSEGYAASKIGGRWGVIDKETNLLIPLEHEGIVLDELGRCYGQGAVFIRKDASVDLYVDGGNTGKTYDDAKPFSNEGYAAVKRDGKWGFIDVNGILRIDFIFDDALSFGGHLAAVKVEDYWGYISLDGQIVIEPVFLEAKSFSRGSAPVLNERGWDFITLIEYREN